MTVDLCRQAGFEPSVVFESNNMETVQSLVAAGMGVTLVPRFISRAPRSEFVPVYLPLAEPVPSRTLVVATVRDAICPRRPKLLSTHSKRR